MVYTAASHTPHLSMMRSYSPANSVVITRFQGVSLAHSGHYDSSPIKGKIPRGHHMPVFNPAAQPY